MPFYYLNSNNWGCLERALDSDQDQLRQIDGGSRGRLSFCTLDPFTTSRQLIRDTVEFLHVHILLRLTQPVGHGLNITAEKLYGKFTSAFTNMMNVQANRDYR
ncbi:hypothetical protein AcV5_008814 [Taiwanofungus camphoratus]|nr:hypothetical protein AcV5_008814 [Antrodia cinnamomea]